MTNATTPERTGWKSVVWPNKWYWKVLAIAFWLNLLASLLLLTASVESSSAAVKPLTRASQVKVGLPAAVYTATLKNLRVHPNPSVAAALLNITEVVETTGSALGRVSPRFTKKCPAGAPKGCPTDYTDGYKPIGCHNKIWRKKSVRIRYVHIEIAWRRTAIDSWCWNRSRITSQGMATGDDGKDAFVAYCWDHTTSGKEWVSNFWQQRVFNSGVLRVCTKLSPQITVSPRIYYKRGGYWNFG